MGELDLANDVFIVHRQDVTQSDFLTISTTPPQSGEVLVRIEKFGLTSNNVTYAALGDSLPYFKFFPVPDDARAEEWGCLPVWGIGQIIQSNVPDLQEGTRLYGFFPAASYITMKSATTTTTGFRVDRPGIPPNFGFYNLYNLTQLDPFYLADQEDLMIVLRPVFLTGLLLADYLKVNDFRQAEAVLISSAASKTSYGLASALRNNGRCEVIGLASANSQPFAEKMQVYDRVIKYEDIPNLPPTLTAVYVDIAGSIPVRDQLANQLGDGLKLVLGVGMTHWKDASFSKPNVSSGVESEVFFAPGWIARRQKEAGKAFLDQLDHGWQTQMANANHYFKVVSHSGKFALQESFMELTQNRNKPEEALVLSL